MWRPGHRRLRRGWATVVAAVVMAGALVSCGSAPRQVGSSAGPERTVWLCRPGMPSDPCAVSSAATAVAANGTTTAVPAPVPTGRRDDCFYVYPTVSAESTANADLKVQAAEIDAAVLQASRFSQVCNVWAPMYRQLTGNGLGQALGHGGDADALGIAYRSVAAAWSSYLAHDNDGQPIVLIGHSQGATTLIQLLRRDIEPDAALRKRIVSAVLLGGNVQVPTGETVGGSFSQFPLCGAPSQARCVIAYSTFGSPPPPDSYVGRPGQGVSLLWGEHAKHAQEVACTNPAALGGGSAQLQPYFPTASAPTPGVKVTTPWVSFPGLYRATCRRSGGSSWLQVTTESARGDHRPGVAAVLGPRWGYHADDVNLALGNLVADVARQEVAYG